MLKSKATDDDIGDGDDEDQDSGDAVQDVRCLVVLWIIDIDTSQHQEQKTQYHLVTRVKSHHHDDPVMAMDTCNTMLVMTRTSMWCITHDQTQPVIDSILV